MNSVTKLTQAGLNTYIDAVKRECVRLDIVAALEKQHNALLAAITDHPQETLNQFTKKYGIQMDAETEIAKITYLIIMKRQGCDLCELLSAMMGSSAGMLAKFNADFHADLRRHSDSLSHQHTVLFYTPSLPMGMVDAELSKALIKK